MTKDTKNSKKIKKCNMCDVKIDLEKSSYTKEFTEDYRSVFVCPLCAIVCKLTIFKRLSKTDPEKASYIMQIVNEIILLEMFNNNE